MAHLSAIRRIPGVHGRWEWPSLFKRIPYDRLSVFCGNVATCLSAGMRVPESLRISVRHGPSPVVKRIAESAAEQTASGTALSEALEPSADRFPAFFLPVIRCGEVSGRLDETFAYLGRHCALLVKPARLVRSLWLYPLIIIVTGSILKITLVTALAPWATAVSYARDTLADYAIAAIVVAIALVAPQTKAIFDRAKMALPVIRETECDLATNRFFHAMNLVYCTGGMRVESMIRMAARSVDNRLIGDDLLQSATIIESGGTIAEAFAAPRTVSEENKELVRTGEVAGRLEYSFATICRMTEQALEFRITTFNEIFLRIVGSVIVLSIVFTLMGLIGSVRPGT
jgi:type II secretory pathway component PulF